LEGNPFLRGEGCARGADFEKWFKEDSNQYRRAIAAVDSTALNQAIAALTPIGASSPDAGQLAQSLRNALAAVNVPDAPLAPNLQPSLSLVATDLRQF